MIDWSDIAPTDAADPIRVTAPDRAALLQDIETRFAEGRGFSLATLNLDHVVKIRRDPAFRAAYARQSHVTADGNPIVWLCRLAGQKVDLIPGSELVSPVAGLAAKTGMPVALVGLTGPALEAAAAALCARHPGLKIAALVPPPMGFDPDGPEADRVIAELTATGARLCFLALGAPRQERFAARAQDHLPKTGFLSIGAGLDFLAGSQKRAPRIVQALALEWLWRMMGNPGRLAGRYAACFAILPRSVLAALRTRLTTREV
ncbi:MAG: WecB/TagA/CpsF family glycosyltransferase [Pseudomonadota bacterium]